MAIGRIQQSRRNIRRQSDVDTFIGDNLANRDCNRACRVAVGLTFRGDAKQSGNGGVATGVAYAA